MPLVLIRRRGVFAASAFLACDKSEHPITELECDQVVRPRYYRTLTVPERGIRYLGCTPLPRSLNEQRGLTLESVSIQQSESVDVRRVDLVSLPGGRRALRVQLGSSACRAHVVLDLS